MAGAPSLALSQRTDRFNRDAGAREIEAELEVALALPGVRQARITVADSVLSHLYRTGLILEVYDRWFGRFSKKRSRIIETLYQLNATPE